jgi:hypothetical protein
MNPHHNPVNSQAFDNLMDVTKAAMILVSLKSDKQEDGVIETYEHFLSSVEQLNPSFVVSSAKQIAPRLKCPCTTHSKVQ